MTEGEPRLRVDVHLSPGDLTEGLRADAAAGLTSTPKTMPPKWFYDERGSILFDQITRLPEYYPTAAERTALADAAPEIARAAGADTLVEIGSGTSEKTRLLLSALADAGTLCRFIPFDVSESVLREAGPAIAAAYPGIEVHAVVGDFERHLGLIPVGGTRLVAFLGSTIGNLDPKQRAHFLASISEGLGAGDHLLLGTDLVKDPVRLVRAYDDSQGLTAEFNRNLLTVLNRDLQADFVPDQFAHVVRWDPDREWIEMHLEARTTQQVKVPAIGAVVDFAEGERLRTEVSAKFRQATVESELGAAGMELVTWWTDPAGDVALSLARRSS